ncbi:hypothetical protein CBR_g26053 [Chara braunii]|uniref:ATP-dependent (S)-NAD(P)H-hydrate dehydratase n=1 Tax=Chara braunii TaxID=69332 RepID=A0A388L742_CHABU|nr:hypothetical protein CBR_g26053 [Chara braunii]|eukprot:GBG78116.1 hypothetical protein CBR_g26053 [Chara braunii]
MLWSSLESVLSAIRAFVPQLSPGKHKGQAGKIAVVGGCREYTGAPYFAAISALKLGADLSHVFCTKDAGPVIKSYSPELIVHPVLKESYDAKFNDQAERTDVIARVVHDVLQWLPRFDCLVVGPGLGRDSLVMDSVEKIIQHARAQNVPVVIDGDGLFLVTNKPELVQGYPLAILTPNVNEHRRLVAKVLGNGNGQDVGIPDILSDSNPSSQLILLAERLGHITIVQKGPTDHISDGHSVLDCGMFGSPRRCGGQGDVLSGSIAVFMAWANDFSKQDDKHAKQLVEQCLSGNPAVMASYAGSLLLRRAASAAFASHKRSMVTTDIIRELGASVEALFPVDPVEESYKSR